MKMLKIAGGVLLAGFIMTFGSEIGDRLSIPGAERWVATADAIVGRPLTPVSVAGVARRSVRRCAVGVYRCSLPADRSLSAHLVVADHSDGMGFFPLLMNSDPTLLAT
jgi:hypothetical protein